MSTGRKSPKARRGTAISPTEEDDLRAASAAAMASTESSTKPSSAGANVSTGPIAATNGVKPSVVSDFDLEAAMAAQLAMLGDGDDEDVAETAA